MTPAMVLLYRAFAIALGGDCLADIGPVQSTPASFGRVESDPMVFKCRPTGRPTGDVDRAVKAIEGAKARLGQPRGSQPVLTPRP